MRKKRILICILIPFLIIVLAVVGIVCYYFIPRKLTNIVPIENISSIYYEYDTSNSKNQILLTEREQRELSDDLSKMKYRLGKSPEKAVSSNRLCVSYNDGSLIKIDSLRVSVLKDGKWQGYQVKFLGDFTIFRFFQIMPDYVLK